MKKTIAKINKTKSWFFEKINKTDKPLDRYIKKKKKRRKFELTKLEMKKEEITADNTETQKLIREYYKKPYANKMGNLEEINRYLEKFNLTRLDQEETEIMNKPL